MWQSVMYSKTFGEFGPFMKWVDITTDKETNEEEINEGETNKETNTLIKLDITNEYLNDEKN